MKKSDDFIEQGLDLIGRGLACAKAEGQTDAEVSAYVHDIIEALKMFDKEHFYEEVK
jgi:hypothetical protein